MNAFEIIKKEITEHPDREIFILGHIQPDGDCMGSSLGLYYLLKENFCKESVVINQKIDRFAFLGKSEEPYKRNFEGSFVIQVDNSVRNRSADENFMKAGCILKIDHHVVMDSYGTYNIEEQLSSCCEIIAEHAIKAGMVINADAARCLYTGMVTDTGRFLYPGVNAETFRIAATLLESGFDFSDLMSRINSRDLNTVNYISYAYNAMKMSKKGVLWIYITQDIIDKFNLTPDKVSTALECMRGVEGHPVSVLFADLGDKVRVEFRSDRIQLDHVARSFGGGGHKFAAGARLATAEKIPQVVAALDELL